MNGVDYQLRKRHIRMPVNHSAIAAVPGNDRLKEEDMTAYTATTQDITVTVQPLYLDGQSDPLVKRFVFAYFVRIQNDGGDEVQLLRRRWHISDSNGDLREVEGEGVVGQKPTILPGASHEYNSYCVLETFEGSMEGIYTMSRAGGEHFDVVIPRFVLRAAAN